MGGEIVHSVVREKNNNNNPANRILVELVRELFAIGLKTVTCFVPSFSFAWRRCWVKVTGIMSGSAVAPFWWCGFG